MRENRPYGSEGGVAKAIPTPIRSTSSDNGAIRLRLLRPTTLSPCGGKAGERFLGLIMYVRGA
jgi:hypothetical protein